MILFFFFYSAFLAVELLSEVVQSCSLNEAEIEQQRGVVLRELEEVEGNLQEVCLDLLHATAFQGTPLGHSVLGPSNNARQEEQHAQSYFVEMVTHSGLLSSKGHDCKRGSVVIKGGRAGASSLQRVSRAIPGLSTPCPRTALNPKNAPVAFPSVCECCMNVTVPMGMWQREW